MTNALAGLQKLGRALMLPIAVMPLAALLLRLGQSDLLDMPFVAAAGAAVFNNLGILFAVGVAIGFAKETHGAAALAGAVGYFIAMKGTESLVDVPAEVVAGLSGPALELATAKFKSTLMNRFSIPVGLLSGLIAGAMYNRFHGMKLPDYLAFFGGRRFVPIITGLACLVLAVIVGFGLPYLQAGMDAGSRSVLASGVVGLFFYGLLNRLLIVTGLHHIINNIAWFLLGDYGGTTGDLNRFFAGDPSAGAFMTGFFPVMMFGLPAACLAMYRSARTEKRRQVAGVLSTMALTSFLTGVTEPVEFAFMFVAPLLYGIHAVLTGIALVIMSLLNVKLGFGFSAGLLDYVLNYSRSTNPLLLLPVGAIYFAVYYALFRFAIVRFDLKTMGREDEATTAAAPAVAAPAAVGDAVPIRARSRGENYLDALGGAGNVKELSACATRLRVAVSDGASIDESALKRLGARGVVRVATGHLQVIIGPQADQLAVEIQDAMQGERSAGVSGGASGERSQARGLLDALGGRDNVREIDTCATRLRLRVVDSGLVNDAILKRLGARGVVRPAAGSVQVILGPNAELVADEIRALLSDDVRRASIGS